jgi:hypothetical protein
MVCWPSTLAWYWVADSSALCAGTAAGLGLPCPDARARQFADMAQSGLSRPDRYRAAWVAWRLGTTVFRGAGPAGGWTWPDMRDACCAWCSGSIAAHSSTSRTHSTHAGIRRPGWWCVVHGRDGRAGRRADLPRECPGLYAQRRCSRALAADCLCAGDLHRLRPGPFGAGHRAASSLHLLVRRCCMAAGLYSQGTVSLWPHRFGPLPGTT